MLKAMVVLAAFLVLAGCESLEQKADRYRDASRMAANPEHVEVHYRRDGNEASFYERRCSGELCTEDLDAFIVPLRAAP